MYLSKCLLNSETVSASTTTSDSLFQITTLLWVQNVSLWSLNFPPFTINKAIDKILPFFLRCHLHKWAILWHFSCQVISRQFTHQLNISICSTLGQDGTYTWVYMLGIPNYPVWFGPFLWISYSLIGTMSHLIVWSPHSVLMFTRLHSWRFKLWDSSTLSLKWVPYYWNN